MTTILSTVVSILAFRLRSRASLELELIALRHRRDISVLFIDRVRRERNPSGWPIGGDGERNQLVGHGNRHSAELRRQLRRRQWRRRSSRSPSSRNSRLWTSPPADDPGCIIAMREYDFWQGQVNGRVRWPPTTLRSNSRYFRSRRGASLGNSRSIYSRAPESNRRIVLAT